MHSVAEVGSLQKLLKELEDLEYRVKYLGHKDELTLEVLQRVIERIRHNRGSS